MTVIDNLMEVPKEINYSSFHWKTLYMKTITLNGCAGSLSLARTKKNEIYSSEHEYGCSREKNQKLI